MIDLVAIGSALMDITVEVEDRDLERLGLKKGNMHLVEEDTSKNILQQLARYRMVKTPGGSAANAAAGVAVLGGKSVFIGKVGNDKWGDAYRIESEKMGVKTKLGEYGKMTGIAITLITPDSERTFATYLGAALFLRREDIDEELVKHAKAVHIEAYLLEDPDLTAASVHAMELAKSQNVKVSMDLSDPALIERNLKQFRHIIKDYVDIVFANEEEAQIFTGKEPEKAIDELGSFSEIAIVKLGSRGSIIKSGSAHYSIPAYKAKLVNTNGAGDMYAAGILYGIANDYSLDHSGRIASKAASMVVSQIGARLTSRLNVSQMGI